jgi:transposase-like protein
MSERIDKQHRYPWSVIELAVLWYQRDNLTFRAVSDKLLSHGVQVSHKTVYEWSQKFGELVSKRAKKRPGRSSYSIEESYVKVNGEWKYMYSAVDKQGNVLNAVLRERRNLASAKSFLAKNGRDNDVSPT